VEDGVEAAVVTYEAAVPVVSDTQALSPGAPLVHDNAPANTLLDVSMFATEGIDDVFADAPHVVRVRSKTGRQNALPLETRGVVASWDDHDEQLHLRMCTQVPHQVRTVLAQCLRRDERTVRVTVPDMGGGFGQKCVVGREEIAVGAACLKVGRPWIDGAIEQIQGTARVFTPDGPQPYPLPRALEAEEIPEIVAQFAGAAPLGYEETPHAGLTELRESVWVQLLDEPIGETVGRCVANDRADRDIANGA